MIVRRSVAVVSYINGCLSQSYINHHTIGQLKSTTSECGSGKKAGNGNMRGM